MTRIFHPKNEQKTAMSQKKVFYAYDFEETREDPVHLSLVPQLRSGKKKFKKKFEKKLRLVAKKNFENKNFFSKNQKKYA